MRRAQLRFADLIPTSAAALLITLSVSGPVLSQDRAAGPWWPHPIWGATEEAGSSNWITPELVLRAAQLVETGKVYELGQVYEHGMPLFGQRTYTMTIPGSPSGGPVGENQLVWHDEFLCGEIGQIGTQFDGPGYYRHAHAHGGWHRDRGVLQRFSPLRGSRNIWPEQTRYGKTESDYCTWYAD